MTELLEQVINVAITACFYDALYNNDRHFMTNTVTYKSISWKVALNAVFQVEVS
jgi:hypothetical protein